MPVLLVDSAFLFALATAFAWAFADFGMRYGVQHTNPFVGSMMWPFVAVLTLLALILLLGVQFPPFGEHYLWLAAAGVEFVIEPHTRFAGEPGEQSTMFFYDPSGNALEFKAFGDVERQLFAR